MTEIENCDYLDHQVPDYYVGAMDMSDHNDCNSTLNFAVSIFISETCLRELTVKRCYKVSELISRADACTVRITYSCHSDYVRMVNKIKAIANVSHMHRVWK